MYKIIGFKNSAQISTIPEEVGKIAHNYYSPNGSDLISSSGTPRILSFQTAATRGLKGFKELSGHLLGRMFDIWFKNKMPSKFEVLELGPGTGDLLNYFLSLKENPTLLKGSNLAFCLFKNKFLKALQFHIFDLEDMIPVHRKRFGNEVRYHAGDLNENLRGVLAKIPELQFVYGNEIPDTLGFEILLVEEGKVYKLEILRDKTQVFDHTNIAEVMDEHIAEMMNELNELNKRVSDSSNLSFLESDFDGPKVRVEQKLSNLRKLNRIRTEIMSYLTNCSIKKNELTEEQIEPYTKYSKLPTCRDNSSERANGEYIVHTNAFKLFEMLVSSNRSFSLTDYYEGIRKRSDQLRMYPRSTVPCEKGNPSFLRLTPSQQLLYIIALSNSTPTDITTSPLITKGMLDDLGLNYIQIPGPNSEISRLLLCIERDGKK